MAGNSSQQSGREIPEVNSCLSHRRGHQMHWIPVRRHFADREPARVLGFEGDVVLVQMPDGAQRRWWHHQPARLRAVVQRHGPEAEVIPALDGLICGGHWFSCADADDELTPCAIELPDARATLRRWLAGELWAGRDSLAVSSGWGRTTLTRRYDASTGHVHLTCATPGMVVPRRDRRGAGVFGAWSAGVNGGADLTVSFTVPPRLEDRREALTLAAAADLVHTALAESSGWFPMTLLSSADSPARLALPLLQDQMLWDLPGWGFEHEDAGSTAELGTRARLRVAIAPSRWLGEGLRVDVELPGLTRPPAGEAHTSFGAWAVGDDGLRYSAFLSNDLLAAVPDFPGSAHVLTLIMGGLAELVDDALDRP